MVDYFSLTFFNYLLCQIIVLFDSPCLTFNISDEITHAFFWPGGGRSMLPSFVDKNHKVEVLSSRNEAFQCYAPKELLSIKNKDAEDYDGPNEDAIISPLLTGTLCSYKVDNYWTYELCHGKRFRQYHYNHRVELGSKPVQEYILGNYKKRPDTNEEVEEASEREIKRTGKAPKTLPLDGKEVPYFMHNYTDGTLCDLTEVPRMTEVLYICQEQGNGELIDFSEINTCQYRAIVATKLLCKHPAYQEKKPHINKITCVPRDVHAKEKPRALTELESSTPRKSQSSDLSALFGHEIVGSGLKIEATQEKNVIVYKIKSSKTEHLLKDGSSGKKINEFDANANFKSEESKLAEFNPSVKKTVESAEIVEPLRDTESMMEKPIGKAVDKKADLREPMRSRMTEVRRFIEGSVCLTGGKDWWKHEVCHGKQVLQYHLDAKTKERIDVILGRWSRAEHIKKLILEPSLKPHADPKAREHVTLYFGDGDFCEATNRNRFVLVTYRCRPLIHGAVQMVYSETSTCQYSISLEGQEFCELLQKTDEFGLFTDIGL